MDKDNVNAEKEVLLDLNRRNRTGLSEAVFCEGKSLAQLSEICTTIQEKNLSMLFTRLSKTQFSHIDSLYPNLVTYDEVSRMGLCRPPSLTNNIQVAIVGGGSSDASVMKEAKLTLRYYGINCLEIHDVGVAGLWRLTERLKEIGGMKIVICIAGMDAALPTVLAGLIPSIIIAVPTSVGYGVTRNGETALAALLVSCASGMTVVNIDNGYGAACAAIRTLNQL
ncbi:MAG: nickel pincer cofactor biosynthesis protein LarB [Pseudomonadales bacterium]|nr:nickel pincer cofactor biosynthesis protein LarB [Pseudomonadales bacterium]